MLKKSISIITLLLMCISTCGQNIVDTTAGLDVRVGNDYKKASLKLSANRETDRLKANAIFNWITHNIEYRVPALDNISLTASDPYDIYERRWGTSSDIAILFIAMCREVNLTAVDIEGYTHEWFYDDGDLLMLPRHTWNAVMINGKWELVDAAFAAGYVTLYNSSLQKKRKNRQQDTTINNRARFWEKYNGCFMADPREFRITHLPADPIWQLTEHKMSVEIFEKGIDAIKKYNTKYIFDIKRDDPQLLRMAQMSMDERIDENADRVYKYNANYVAALAFKQTTEGNALLTLYNRRDNRKYSFDSMLTLAKARFTKALDLHKEQYKLFKPYYDEFANKNTTKNKEAISTFRVLKQRGRLNTNKSALYRDAAVKNATNYQSKTNSLKETLNQLNPDSIINALSSVSQRKGTDAELKRLNDTIDVRQNRIVTLSTSFDKLGFAIIGRASENYERLQQWEHNLRVADSFLMIELSLRKKLYDNNDSELIVNMNTSQQSRYETSDTLLKYLLLNYDTINRLQAVVLNNYTEVLNTYKISLKDIEQYMRTHLKDSMVSTMYSSVSEQYKYIILNYSETLNSYYSYENNNAVLYGNTADMYDTETRILNEAELAESRRFATERYDITDHRTYNEEKSLRYQTYNLNMIKEVEKLIQAEKDKNK